METPSPVAHATRADLAAISTTLARAFDADPVQQWVFADVPDRLASLGRFMAFFAERYFTLGHTYVAGGAAGATMWAPPDRHALAEADIPALLDVMAADLSMETAIERLTELGRSIEYLPSEPHFYLGIAGVDPASQGHGLGGALLAPGLRAADEGGFITHLESSNPKNIPFYERHGFRVVDVFHCGGPDGPAMTVMSRAPRAD